MTSPGLPVSGRVGAGKKGRSDLLLAVAMIAPAFVGFKNYLRMLEAPVFWNAAGVTVYCVMVDIGVQAVLALLIAVLMHRLTQSTRIRSIVLAPYLVSNVVAVLVFMWLLDTRLGIGNQVLASEVTALTAPGFEAVFIGQKDVSHLTEVNHQVNRLLSLTS